VQKAYGNEAVNRSNVFSYYSQFGGGRELVTDDYRSGRPKSTRTEIIIAADLVKNDRRIVSRMIAESLTIPRRILKEDLSRKIFSCCRIMRPPTKLQVFASVWPPKILQSLSPPVLSRFISARLFSVPQFENEVKRTPLSGCCWDPRSSHR
jgi:hypothetical protein